MKLRIFQTVLAVTMLVAVMLTPVLTSPAHWPATRRGADSWLPFEPHQLALAQDDNADNDDGDNADNDDGGDNDDDNDDGDEDNDDNDDGDDDGDNDDADNDDGDNADNEDSDNSDADNSDADNSDGDNGDADNDDDLADNVDAGGGSLSGPIYAFDPSVTEMTGRSTGADGRIALPGDRIVVQLFPWMPPDITISVRLLDPLATPPPGMLVGALIFELAATDANGFALTALPAEINLSARYTDQELGGLNEAGVILLWQDPFDQQWKPAPKLVANAPTNYIAASVTGLGRYAVVIR